MVENKEKEHKEGNPAKLNPRLDWFTFICYYFTKLKVWLENNSIIFNEYLTIIAS